MSSRSRQKYVGNYALEKTLGEGTFGKVKLGKHLLTDEKVAIKVLEKDKIEDAIDRERVDREIKIMKLLDHPNIVRLYEVIDSPKYLYLVTEYAAGGELFDYIVAHERVREKEARRFFRQIWAGVQYCHVHQVIHRDLKPENLLLDSNKQIKIIDFGFSNKAKHGEFLKTFCGSPAYAAPEMIAGNEYQGPEADIWSMGIILYALLCGYLPFDHGNISKLYQLILKGRYEVPSWVGSDAKNLIARMLTMDPKKRISLDGIRLHRWMSDSSLPTLQLYELPASDIVKYTEINEDALMELENIGFDVDDAVESLEKGSHNQTTATYNLLVERITREKKEGKRREPGTMLRPLPQAAQGNSNLAPDASFRASRRSSQVSTLARQALLKSAVDTQTKPDSVIAPLPASRQRRHSIAISAPRDPPPVTGGKTADSGSSTKPASGSRGRVAVATPGMPPGLAEFAAAWQAKQAAGEGGNSGEVPAIQIDKAPPEKDTKGKQETDVMNQAQLKMAMAVQQSRGRRHSAAVGALPTAPPKPEGQDELRAVRGAFNVGTTSSKTGKAILSEVQRVLNTNNIQYAQNNYVLDCQDTKSGVKFELEVCKLRDLTLNGIRLKRVSGDTWAYKKLCHQLASKLKL